MAHKSQVTISMIALGISLISALFSAQAFYTNRENKRADIFINLHSRYEKISNKSPLKPIDVAKLERSTAEWALYKKYWYHSFTEWYVTNHLDPSGSQQLWTEYFRDAQKSALTNSAYKKVACDLMEHEFQIMKTRREYVKVLANLMAENGDKKGCKTTKSNSKNNLAKNEKIKS